MSESALPPEQWRPLFENIGVEFGYRPFAAHIGMDHTRLRRLLRGGGTSAAAIQQVADGFRVDPAVVRELRGEGRDFVEPFTLPDDAGRLNETERNVVRAVVRALLDARDNAHADLPATNPPATPEDTPDPQGEEQKTAAQLQADLDALTDGRISLEHDEDRTALMSKLRASIDALQEQAHGAQVHDLADRRRKAHELRGTQDPFDDPNPDGAEWPDGEVVGRGETMRYLQWIASGKPADFTRFREGRQSDHDLAAGGSDERKDSDDRGLDDGDE